MSSKDMQQHPDVEISVRNFGPVSEANINLRPLTVFIGPSNTGKTYLSSLIYALHGAFDGFSAFLNHFIQDSLGDIVYMWHNQPSEAQKESLPIFKKLNTEGRPFKFSDLPQEIRDIVIHVENEFDFRGKPEKRCDRLLFFINTEQKLVAAPIELKSGKATESDVIEKLENSLKFVQSITSSRSMLSLR